MCPEVLIVTQVQSWVPRMGLAFGQCAECVTPGLLAHTHPPKALLTNWAHL